MEVVQSMAPKIGNPVNIEGSSSSAPVKTEAPSSYGGAQAGASSYQNPYARQAQSAAPVARADPNVQVFPISGLNPYQSRWTIKAR